MRSPRQNHKSPNRQSKTYSMHIYNSLPRLKPLTSSPPIDFNLERQKKIHNRIYVNKKQIEAIKKQEYEHKKRILQRKLEDDLNRMDEQINRVKQLVRLKLSVNRKLQILQEDPKKQFNRFKNYQIFTDKKVHKNGKAEERPRQQQKQRKRKKYQIFAKEIIRIAKLLKQFNLKPHEIMQKQLFVKQPYQFGKAIFERVLNNQDQEVFKLLLRDRYVIYSFNHLMMTPLMCATMRGHIKILQMLIEARSWIDQKDSLGNVAINYAAKYGHKDCIFRLILSGCSLDIVNRRGQTCLELAFSQTQRDMIKLGRRVSAVLLQLEGIRREQYLKGQCALYNIQL